MPVETLVAGGHGKQGVKFPLACPDSEYLRIQKEESMQVAIKVYYDTISTLNDYLSKGWKVIYTCPMPGSDVATCLVVIEKVQPNPVQPTIGN